MNLTINNYNFRLNGKKNNYFRTIIFEQLFSKYFQMSDGTELLTSFKKRAGKYMQGILCGKYSASLGISPKKNTPSFADYQGYEIHLFFISQGNIFL